MAEKFKRGDIVKVKKGAFKNAVLKDEYRIKYSNGLGKIKYYYRYGKGYKIQKNNVGDYLLEDESIKIYFSDNDLKLATKKEAFLYYIKGFDALRSK